jgi:hypothetical protein
MPLSFMGQGGLIQEFMLLLRLLTLMMLSVRFLPKNGPLF